MCPALELIAAAASGSGANDVDAAIVLAHAVACPRCAELLREQREIRGFAMRLPVPTLDRDRRAELAAEVMALADAAPRDRRALPIAIGACVAIAAAATIAIVLAMRSMGDPQVATAPPTPPTIEQPRPKPAPVAIDLAPPVSNDPVIEVSTGSKITRRVGATEQVELADGNLTVDARSSRDVAVTAGTTQVAVGRAKATIIAKRGVIRSVQVFAGSVEVTANGQKRMVSAGTIWRSTELLEPKPEVVAPTTAPAPEPEPPKSASELSLQAFRDGYTALRAGRNADAIAAFDRATDPVVAEDAMFWAAVASDRSGDKDDAIRRYTAFLARFPSSPRTGDAKAALAKLGSSPSAPEPKGL